MSDERFSRSIIDVLAKRAGNICSNADCLVLTVGPADEPSRAVVVGEAAHIYGAKPGSARFDASMLDTERSDITNGIWLCRNCHKIVDTDQTQYPAELLFEWRRDHERSTMALLGKAGLLRQKVLDRRLEGFEKCSYLAQQIVIDKPHLWEFKLTAELLRSSLLPIKRRWDDLQGGLYTRPMQIVSIGECGPWFQTRLREMSDLVGALGALANSQFQASWGLPGEPGSEVDIHRVCNLVVEACQNLLAWEENVRFTSAPDAFREVQSLLKGVGGRFIDRVFVVPIWLADVLSAENPSGSHQFTLVFDLPENWSEQVHLALTKARRTLF